MINVNVSLKGRSYKLPFWYSVSQPSRLCKRVYPMKATSHGDGGTEKGKRAVERDANGNR